MKWSQYFLPTLREDPKDAEAVSHKLMVRAGLIRRLGSGAYSYLPLGVRVLHKVMTIIRQEMTRKNLGQPLMFLSGIGGCSLKERDIIRNSIDHEDVLALPPWVRSRFVVRAGEAPLLDGGREVR